MSSYWEKTGEYAHGHEISVHLSPAVAEPRFYWEKTYDQWSAGCDGYTYKARTREGAIAKAKKDPRLDPRSLHRTTGPLVEVRTVLSRAKTARGARFWNESADFEAPEMAAALDQVIALLERWQKPGAKSRGQRNQAWREQLEQVHSA